MLNRSGDPIRGQIKAVQTLSGEIMLPRLLDKVMRLALENGSAEKGVLLLPHQGQWYIEAEGWAGQVEVRVLSSTPLKAVGSRSETPSLAEAVATQVIQTQQRLVLADAAHEAPFADDPYIIRQQPKSVLGLPLLHQGRLTGVLYLENNRATGAFTPERLELLQLLASQAAVCLDNARLYADLQASEQKYRALFEDLTDMIFIAATDGRLIDINPAGEIVLGYTRPEILGLKMPAIYSQPADWDRFQAAMADQGMVQDFELSLRRKDGREIDTLVTATVRPANGGAIQGYQGIIRDVTAQKEAAQTHWRTLELQKDQEATDVAHQAESHLLANMGHKLRTPLNAIIGFANLALHNHDNPADTQEQLSIIIRSSETLLTLINQMLELSKIEAGQLTGKRSAPSPSQVAGLAPGQPRYRLLIVDDDPASRRLLRQMLTNNGQFEADFELREAQHGQQAIELWETFAPHLIWMDLRMPVMDGYEATRQIRRWLDGRPLPIIAVTANAMEGDREKCLSAGMDDYLAKPLRRDSLESTITRWLPDGQYARG